MALAHEDSDVDFDFFDDPIDKRDDTQSSKLDAARSKDEPAHKHRSHPDSPPSETKNDSPDVSRTSSRASSRSSSSTSSRRLSHSFSSREHSRSRSRSRSPEQSHVLISAPEKSQGTAKRHSKADDYSSDSSAVTDVSPLNSPKTKASIRYQTPHFERGDEYDFSDDSPSQHSPAVNDNISRKRTCRNSGSSSKHLVKDSSDQIDMKLLMEVLEMDRGDRPYFQDAVKPRKVLFSSSDQKHNKKNYSFSNDKVQSIDRENQRLMEQIMRQNKTKRHEPVKKAKPKSSRPVLTPSALNRQREQQRIEQENQALLKRLQSAKATKSLKRNDLLQDYGSKLIAGQSVAAAHRHTYTRPVNAHSLYSRSDFDGSSYNHYGDYDEPATVALESGGRRSRPTSAKTDRPYMGRSRPTSGKRPQSAKYY